MFRVRVGVSVVLSVSVGVGLSVGVGVVADRRWTVNRAKTSPSSNINPFIYIHICSSPFHQMVECMKLAARYSDCGKERLHIGEIKRLRQSQGLTRNDCIEGKEQCQLRLYEI